MPVLNKMLRDYMAKIGRRGGQTSRRKLTSEQARRMVAARETNRVKRGRRLH